MTSKFQVSIGALDQCGIVVFGSDDGVLDPGEAFKMKASDGRYYDATVDSILDDGQIMVRPFGASEDRPAISFNQLAESVGSKIRIQIRPIQSRTVDETILKSEAPPFGNTDAFLVCSDQETRKVMAIFRLEGDQAENILVGEEGTQPCGVEFGLQGPMKFGEKEPRNPLKRAAFWKEAADAETIRGSLVFLYTHLRRTENDIGRILSLPVNVQGEEQIQDMLMSSVYRYALAAYSYEQAKSNYLTSIGDVLSVSKR